MEQPSVTSSKVSRYRVFSGPYFPVLRFNTGKYGPEKIPYLDTCHAVCWFGLSNNFDGLSIKTTFRFIITPTPVSIYMFKFKNKRTRGKCKHVQS